MKKLSNKKKLEILKREFDKFYAIRYKYEVVIAIGTPSEKMISDYENALTEYVCYCHQLINNIPMGMEE